jgi:bifunctional ADP-heptose synthase (sugar kinase/adenylyltransferase)
LEHTGTLLASWELTTPANVSATALRELGAPDDDLITDETRPSTIKTRIIAHSQLVVRTDRESRVPVNEKLENRIIDGLKEALANAHAFVVSDYDKGVVTPRILSQILPFAYERVPVLIDPKLRTSITTARRRW